MESQQYSIFFSCVNNDSLIKLDPAMNKDFSEKAQAISNDEFFKIMLNIDL